MVRLTTRQKKERQHAVGRKRQLHQGAITPGKPGTLSSGKPYVPPAEDTQQQQQQQVNAAQQQQQQTQQASQVLQLQQSVAEATQDLEPSLARRVAGKVNEKIFGVLGYLKSPSSLPQGLAQGEPGSGIAAAIGTGGLGLGARGAGVVPGGGIGVMDTTALPVGAAGRPRGATQAVEGARRFTPGQIAKRLEARSITKIASRYGADPSAVGKALQAQKINFGVKIAAALTPGRIAALVGTGGLLGLNTLSSSNAMAAWASLDNGIGGAKFFSNELVGRVEANETDAIEAEKAMEKAMRDKEIHLANLRVATRYNPRLFLAGGKAMLNTAEADAAIIEENMRRIQLKAAEQRQTGQIGQTFEERQAERDARIAESIAERDARFDNK